MFDLNVWNVTTIWPVAVKAIRDRGITCIVIAHRLSTIRSCDEILVMEHGVIRDRGTHQQLLQSSPLYQSLVSAE